MTLHFNSLEEFEKFKKSQANQFNTINSYKSTKNNLLGHQFEKNIELACQYYNTKNIASIEKTPEPFQMIKYENREKGIFLGRFSSRKAQPDFKGILSSGQTIVFEAKSTSNDRILKSVVTENQSNLLKRYHDFKALSFVCVLLQDKYFFIPWENWSNMKKIYGRQYLMQKDILNFLVPYKNGVMFLNNLL